MGMKLWHAYILEVKRWQWWRLAPKKPALSFFISSLGQNFRKKIVDSVRNLDFRLIAYCKSSRWWEQSYLLLLYVGLIMSNSNFLIWQFWRSSWPESNLVHFLWIKNRLEWTVKVLIMFLTRSEYDRLVSFTILVVVEDCQVIVGHEQLKSTKIVWFC